jgi:methylmalonyl-CoA mutase C-terminal domain/subunit
MTLLPRVIELLKQGGGADIAVFAGGIIPDDDIAELKQLGVLEIFTPGASTKDIIEFVRTRIHPRRS